MSTKNIAFGEIANALKSTAADHILGVANDIYDENLGFYQSEINPKNVTYNELKSLRTNNQLVIGCHYKITDFVTTTAQSGTKSGNHAFDIIVKALDVNTLSEDAKACLHNGDTYFQSSNLDAWEIKYCLDNDTDRFSWADTTNGKGVIYYMKDERGNIANYDFKNILFNKDATWLSNNSKIETTVGTLTGKETDSSIYFYTFTYIDNSSIVDGSLLDNIYNNDIKEYKNGGKTTLNNTIFIIHSSNAVFNNRIECDNYNNVLFASDGSISNNEINLKFHDNDIISDYFHTNIIGEEFFSNKISSAFYRNTIGIRCTSCSFNGLIGYTKFGDNIYYVNNHYPITYCEFGSYVQYCVFHNIANITPTYTEMKYCKIGNGNYGLQYIPSMQNVEIEDRCLYNDSNNFEIVNITLVNGERLIDKLIGENLVRLYVKKISGGGVGDTTNPAVISIFKNSDINSFYMGEFASSGNAENVAAEAPIALDFNKRFLRYYIPTTNDNGFIEQVFYTSNNTTPQTVTTVQYQWWDGVKYKRTLVFTDGTRTSKSNWSKVYDITNGEDIFDGTKKFNGDIKLGDKTVIKGPNNIDSGELKVLFGGGSSKGFILRTQNSSSSILPLQLLSTNGSDSYQYNFPTSIGGNVAVGATLDGTTNALASLTKGIIDLSSQFKSTYLYESQLIWGNTSRQNGGTPVDAAMASELSQNRLSFLNPDLITIEFTRNNGNDWYTYPKTYTDAGTTDTVTSGYEVITNTQKQSLITDGLSHTLYLGARKGNQTANDKLRITILGDGVGLYIDLRKILFHYSQAHGRGNYCLLEAAQANDPETFNIVKQYNVSGWTNWNSIPYDKLLGEWPSASGATNTRKLRLTFGVTGVDSTASTDIYVNKLRMFSPNSWIGGNSLTKTGHLYTFDVNKNTTFPANIYPASDNTNDIGSTSKKWANIFATNFNGRLKGNADTATTATTATYIKTGGRLTAETTTNRAAGLRLYEIYSNGYPCTYGNVLQFNGANGVGQLACQWHGTGLWYRSAPDTSTTFTNWTEILTDTNFVAATTSEIQALFS